MRKVAAFLLLPGLAACATPAPPSPRPATPVPVRSNPPRIEPTPFLGLQASQLQALLGAPAFTRKDGATEMWRYDIASCRGFFFFTGTPPKVQHVDTLPEGPGDGADPACLNALRASLPAKPF